MKKQLKSVKHRQAIKRESERRRKQKKDYRRICKQIDKESIERYGFLRCFFCGKPIFGPVDHHHVAGREGTSNNGLSLYLDPEGIISSHPVCHRQETGGYHGKSLSEIYKEIYFSELLKKIKKVSLKKYTDWTIKLEEFKDEQKSNPLDK